MEFTYKGIKITVATNGAFEATVAGRSVTAPSLNAMQARIDKAYKVVFTPFQGVRIEESGWAENRKWKIEKLTIIGLVVKDRRSKYYAQKIGYKASDGNVYESVVLDTGENRRLMMKIIAAHEEDKKREQAYHNLVDALEEKLDERKAADETVV